MKLVTVTKLDGQLALINVNHVVVVFRSEEGSRIVLTNGIDIYAKAPIAEIQRQLDEANAG